MNINDLKIKKCLSCLENKDISEFTIYGFDKSRIRARCKTCLRQETREWNENYIENKDKKCRICNKIKPIEEFNKIYPIGRRHNYCKDCKNQKGRNVEHSDWRLRLMDGAKARSKKQKVPINIVLDDIIINDNCPILGIKLEKGNGKTTDNSPSLDKIIPELGYVKGNIMVISHKSNSIKRDANADELEKIAQYIRNNSPIQIEYYI